MQYSALLGPPTTIRVDASRLRGALHRPPAAGGSRGGSRLGSEAGEPAPAHAAAAHGEEGSEAGDLSDDEFESITTLSVGSSLRSRRTGASAGGSHGGRHFACRPPSGAAASAAAAASRERVRAWADDDPGHTGLEVTVRSVSRISYHKPLDRPFFSLTVRDVLMCSSHPSLTVSHLWPLHPP